MNTSWCWVSDFCGSIGGCDDTDEVSGDNDGNDSDLDDVVGGHGIAVKDADDDDSDVDESKLRKGTKMQKKN